MNLLSKIPGFKNKSSKMIFSLVILVFGVIITGLILPYLIVTNLSIDLMNEDNWQIWTSVAAILPIIYMLIPLFSIIIIQRRTSEKEERNSIQEILQIMDLKSCLIPIFSLLAILALYWMILLSPALKDLKDGDDSLQTYTGSCLVKSKSYSKRPNLYALKLSDHKDKPKIHVDRDVYKNLNDFKPAEGPFYQCNKKIELIYLKNLKTAVEISYVN